MTAWGKAEELGARGVDQVLQALGGFEPRARHRDAEPGDLLLGGGKPARVRAAVFQEPVAASERLLEFGDARAMLGIDAERQAVDEAPPVSGGAREQSVHRRRQPDDLQPIAEGARRRDGETVHAKAPALNGLEPMTELNEMTVRLELDRNAEAARSFLASAVLAFGAPQTAPRREHRERFEEIGLAGAVLAGQSHEALGEADVERFV